MGCHLVPREVRTERVSPQATAWGAYKTIAEALRQRIVQGEFAPGTMLPSEADMTSLYGVSRGTSRQAFLELQAMGLIDAVQGKGRFVKTSRNRDV